MPTKAQLKDRLRRARSGVYYARFTDRDGKRRWRTTGAKTEEEALKVLEESKVVEMEAHAKAGTLRAEALTVLTAGKKLTCADAVDEWAEWRKLTAAPNTLRTQTMVLAQLLERTGAAKWPIAKLRFEHLDAFVNDRKDGTKLSNRLVRLAAIRSFCAFLSAAAYCVGDPSRLVKVKVNNLTHEQKESKVRVPMTEEEFHKIMAGTEGKWRAWTALGYWAGLRLSDCAALEWASITPDEIIVWTRKGERRVALRLDDPLLGGGALRFVFFELLETAGKGRYVWPEDRAISLDPERRSRHSVYYGRILERLGIEGKSFHCLRHAFATRLDAAGKKLEDIGRLLGHSPSSTAVTSGYIHNEKSA